MALRMKYASFFSGIGLFEAALDSAGMECVFSCEIDPFCEQVYTARYGHGFSSKDIAALKPEEIPDADLWVGGFPCQDLSVAGRRGGIQANRSGLVWKLLELAKVRKPHRLWLENVPGLLSSKDGRDFGLLLREVEKLGYVGTWRVLDAQFFGVPQRRRRVFIVASLGADCGCEILLEPESGRRHPPKGRQKGKIAAGELARSLGGVGGVQDFGANKGTLLAHGVSASKGHHGHSSPRGDGTDDLVVAGTIQSCAPGQGRKTPEVDQIAHAVQKSSGGSIGGRDGQDDYVVGALTSHKKRHGSEATSGQAAESRHIVEVPKVFSIMPEQSGKNYKAREVQVTQPVMATGQNHGNQGGDLVVAAPITSGSHPNSNAPSRRREDDENIVLAFQSTGGSRDVQAGEKSPPLKVGTGLGIPSPPAVAREGTSIRRLTPTECERLMGAADGHTCLCGVRPDCPDRRIPPWIDPSKIILGGCGHSACGCTCSDSARYRALGNAVAVPVIRWIADRMMRYSTDVRL